MQLTNTTDLPAPIAQAIEYYAGDYDKGGADFSVTDLISPPQLYALRRTFDDRLVEDVADRIWMLFGHVMHDILSKSARNRDDQIEERLFMQVLGKVISGKFDHLALTNAVLSDYKVTSVWSVIMGEKEEWVKQLNYYAQLCRANGREVYSLQIVALLRDWRLSEKQRNENYPERNVHKIDIPMWPEEETIREMARDVQQHIDALEGNYRPCTFNERWGKQGKFALMKTGRKSAVRLFDSRHELLHWTLAEGLSDEDDNLKNGYDIEIRPSSFRRCEEYCPVSEFCEQKKESEA